MSSVEEDLVEAAGETPGATRRAGTTGRAGAHPCSRGCAAPRRASTDQVGPVDEEDHPGDGAHRVLAHREGAAARRAGASVRRAAHARDGGPCRQRRCRLSHPLLADRPAPARVGVLALTSDRGLAGAYSANVLQGDRGRVCRTFARAGSSRSCTSRARRASATSGSAACRSRATGRGSPRCRPTTRRRRSAGR